VHALPHLVLMVVLQLHWQSTARAFYLSSYTRLDDIATAESRD